MAESDAPSKAKFPDGVQYTEKNIDPKEYTTELRKELADLEFAQYLQPSEYKWERIRRLQSRLGIEFDPKEKFQS